MIGSCRLDGYSMIVMRGVRAIHLGPIEFAIFRELANGERRSANELAYVIYRDRIRKSCANLVSVVICKMNSLKLLHVGLRIRCTRRSWMSYYELVVHDVDRRRAYQGESAQILT